MLGFSTAVFQSTVAHRTRLNGSAAPSKSRRFFCVVSVQAARVTYLQGVI
jgi:hypothetical protein